MSVLTFEQEVRIARRRAQGALAPLRLELLHAALLPAPALLTLHCLHLSP